MGVVLTFVDQAGRKVHLTLAELTRALLELETRARVPEIAEDWRVYMEQACDHFEIKHNRSDGQTCTIRKAEIEIEDWLVVVGVLLGGELSIIPSLSSEWVDQFTFAPSLLEMGKIALANWQYYVLGIYNEDLDNSLLERAKAVQITDVTTASGYFLDTDITLPRRLKFKWILGRTVQRLDYFDPVKHSFKAITPGPDDLQISASEHLEDTGISACSEEMDNYFATLEDEKPIFEVGGSFERANALEFEDMSGQRFSVLSEDILRCFLFLSADGYLPPLDSHWRVEENWRISDEPRGTALSLLGRSEIVGYDRAPGCTGCNSAMYFAFGTSQDAEFHRSLGIDDVLECIHHLIAQGQLPKLPPYWESEVMKHHGQVYETRSYLQRKVEGQFA
jgi:hypothetical protein